MSGTPAAWGLFKCANCSLSLRLSLSQDLLEDEMNLVPPEFAPLSLSPRPKLPPHYVYTRLEVSVSQLSVVCGGSEPLECVLFCHL